MGGGGRGEGVGVGWTFGTHVVLTVSAVALQKYLIFSCVKLVS